MILADFCNRPNSTSTRATARLPRRRALRSTLDAGGGSFDAVPPASIALSTLSSRAARRGAPHRRGASLWRRYQPLAALEARSLTPPVPKPRRAGWVRAGCSVPSSNSTSRPARGAFHRQVLPAPACAGQGTRHHFSGPMATELASDATPSALSLRRLNCAGIQGSSPRSPAAGAACRFLQSSRFSSTTAVRPSTPRTVKGVAPLGRSCGQPCTSRCKAGRAVSGQGPPRVETLASAPSGDDSPRGFAPIRSARTPPVANSRLRRSKNSDARKGTSSRESATGRRAGRRPDKGGCFCPPATGDVSCIPEVPSIDRQPGGRHNTPQAVSNLWTTSCGAFGISA